VGIHNVGVHGVGMHDMDIHGIGRRMRPAWACNDVKTLATRLRTVNALRKECIINGLRKMN
jgi:hypothetical protein